MEIIREVQEIMDRIEEAGHDVYAVGGSVRDALLGKAPYDWDLATGASAETIVSLFPRTAKVGIKFGIVKVIHEGVTVDVATYRIDGPYEDCRRPCHVDFTDNLEEDLKRRDFTINAMAFSPKRGLKDPFGGQADLERRVIKTVGHPTARFKEDALRILRAVRFAGQLDFDIDQATLSAMKEKAELLSLISIERIREEFEKMSLSEKAGKSFRLCLDLGLLPYILGEGFRSINSDEKQKFLKMAETIDASKANRDIRLSLFILCFGTDKTMKAIDRLRFDNLTKTKLKSIKYLVEDLPQIQTKEALKKFICRNSFDTYQFAEEVAGELAEKPDNAKRPAAEIPQVEKRKLWLAEITKNREAIFQADLAVNGNDLIRAGVAKGANVGKVLLFLLDHVHLYPLDNETDILLAKATAFKQHS